MKLSEFKQIEARNDGVIMLETINNRLVTGFIDKDKEVTSVQDHGPKNEMSNLNRARRRYGDLLAMKRRKNSKLREEINLNLREQVENGSVKEIS